MKKIQIIIITVALVLTLGCVGTFAVLYFATDTFKSDKELFYKYASQINLKEFIDLESYNAYSKRLKTMGHASEGEFSIELVQGEESISESIKYNGYLDPVNKTANYDISLNKNNETLLAMNYLNKQDFYGILFKDIVNQYVVFENNNLKEFAQKMGLEDISEIPDKIEIPETNINYEEISSIVNKYLNIAMGEMAEENYIKIKKQDIIVDDEKVEADGYQIKLKVKDVQNILIKVLEDAKNDEKIFNLLNVKETVAFEDYQALIDQILVGVSEEILSEEDFEVITISVYKDGKDTVKLALAITMEEEVNVEFSVEKTAKGMMIKFINTTVNYDETEEKNIITITKTVNTEEQENFECVLSQISDEEEMQLLTINILRNGSLTSNNIEFSTNVTINVEEMVSTNAIIDVEEIRFEIGMQSNTNFAGVPLEGQFVQGNHLVINGLAPEQITNLFTNLGSMLAEKLKDEMFVTLITRYTMANNEIIDSAKNHKIQIFNSQFTAYEGIKNGSTIRSLIATITASNNTNPEHIVTYSGPSQEEVEASKTYKVSSIIDNEGYICRIIIQENEQNEETTSDYRPVMPGNTSSETQNSNQSTMSQMFSNGQEFLNN